MAEDIFLAFDEYQALAMTTAQYPEKGEGSFISIGYVGLGCAGEGGEIAEQVKKMWRNEGELTGERRDKILAEVGDALWYLAAMCTELNADFGEVAQANLDKLADRAERGVIKGEGDTR